MKVNTIYNRDCFEGIKEIETDSVDVCFTSPPYNRIRNDTYAHYDDTQEDYYGFLVRITDEMLRVAKRQVIVNVQMNHFNKVEVLKFLGNYAHEIKGIVVWEKSNPQPATNLKNDEYSVTNAIEFFIIIGGGGKEFRANNKVKNIITTSVNSEHYDGHGAVMKKEVCDFFIKNFTKKGELVLDPFMGCGTTAVCCYEQDRDYIGFEIVPEYIQYALQRIENVNLDKDQISLFEG